MQESQQMRSPAEAVASSLKAGALSLPQVVMQAITLIGPALAVFLVFQSGVTLAGINAPLVYLGDVVLVLMLGSTLVQLSRAFPSAGGYFTYVSRTLHPRVGFMASWLFVLYTALIPGMLFAYMGRVLQNTVAPYGVNIPWWVFFAAMAAFVAFIVYRGIDISGKALLGIGLLEIAIVVVFSVWGFFRPGPGGVNAQPFNPGHISFTAFYLAAVFGMFNYTGWEGAAPVAEESKNPRRDIPIATIVAIVFNCVLITICTWGLLSAWGTDRVASIITAKQIPPITLAHRLWGPVWWLVVFALVNSVLASSIASSIVSTRMWYAMGRVGALPRAFATIHERYRSPSTATWLQIALFIVVGVGGALLTGIDNIYLVGGLTITFAAIIIYVLANVGLTVHMWRRDRRRFNWLLHFGFPVVSTVALAILFYKSLIPLPASPIIDAPVTVLVWLIVGVVVLFALARRGREDWLIRASAAAEGGTIDTIQEPDGRQHDPALVRMNTLERGEA